jgi:hypothetical protein
MKLVVSSNAGDFLSSWVTTASPKGISSTDRERKAFYVTMLPVAKITKRRW